MTATVPIQEIRSLRSASSRLRVGGARAGRARMRRTRVDGVVDRVGALEVARTQQRELLLDRGRQPSKAPRPAPRRLPLAAQAPSSSASHVRAAASVTSAWTASGTRRAGGWPPTRAR